MSKYIDGLYHKDIGLPIAASKFRIGNIPLVYSLHAMFEAKKDRYDVINLPKMLDTNSATVIELEIKNKRINKIVFRVNYSAVFDLVVVLSSSMYVKTVWLNKKTDQHKTLNKTLYKLTG